MLNLREILNKYKNEKIAIYGLGVETEKVLNEIGLDVDIIGLLDGYRKDGELYGKSIISIDMAIEEQVKLILVVARPGSCRAIEKRIGKICTDNEIDLIDIRGNDLCFKNKEVFGFDKTDIYSYTKSELMKKISDNDIISFDLFDTLIMRQTLFSEDVFDLLACKLSDIGIKVSDFSLKRLLAEKELSKKKAPLLLEIYSYMNELFNIKELEPYKLAQMEWEMDYELLVPRVEMKELIDYAVSKGKQIYIVSDSYYNREQLIKFCDKCKIVGYKDIIVSCEYGVGKTQGLFNRFIEITNGTKYLHIGDDLVADVESAKVCGVETCQIYSGLELFEKLGYLGIWDVIQSLSDKLKVGMFVSKLFNSPFQFEKDEKIIDIKNSYDLGFLFFAPIITDFILWFKDKVDDIKSDNILFGARDGYLIKKLYDKIRNNNKSIYFLTSRTAAIRAGIIDKNDIKYVEDMKFSGTINQQLLERFGIDIKENIDFKKKSIIDYYEEIIERSIVCRENYLKYIDSLGISKKDSIFFDFVAKGTTQLFLEKIISNSITGLYFLQLEPDYMKSKNIRIESFFEARESELSAIYEYYYVLETVLTAPHSSVYEFDFNGNPIYAKEMRTQNDLETLEEMHRGIIDYFDSYMRICGDLKIDVNKTLDEFLLSFISKFKISDEKFLAMKVEDPFFNRMTNITDIILG